MNKILPIILIIAGLGIITTTVVFYQRNTPAKNITVDQTSDERTSNGPLCSKFTDAKVCNGTTECIALFDNNTFSTCAESGLSESEINKVTGECTKLKGTFSKTEGKYACNCSQKNAEGKEESAYCLEELISEFESN